MFLLRSLFILSIILVVSYCVVDRAYYIYLGLPITAGQQEIESAYQTKRIKIDGLDDQTVKDKKRKVLEQAYSVLKDQNKRNLYDKFGKDAIKKTNLMDMAQRITQQNNRKDKSIKITLPVSVEDIYKGKTVKAHFYKNIACDHCKGTGAQSPKSLKQCTLCGGNGFNVVNSQNMYGQPVTMEATCQSCGGSGKKILKACPHCNGKKITDKLETVEIKIPHGLPDGNVINIKNFGDQPTSGAPSDLEVTIVEIPTQYWAREGQNLIYTMQIGLKESIFGFEKEFISFDGQSVPITREGATTKDSKVILKEQGLQNIKTGNRGNLIVKFRIIMPAFSDKQLDMWEQFFKNNKI